MRRPMLAGRFYRDPLCRYEFIPCPTEILTSCENSLHIIKKLYSKFNTSFVPRQWISGWELREVLTSVINIQQLAQVLVAAARVFCCSTVLGDTHHHFIRHLFMPPNLINGVAESNSISNDPGVTYRVDPLSEDLGSSRHCRELL